jgi:hypothetical protein
MDKESITLFASLSSGLATIVLAYLTWRYVKLTHEMVNEIKKARNPIVTINFFKAMQGHSMTRIYMIISNIGLSPAKDINLRAECKLKFIKLKLLKENLRQRFLN